MTAARTGELLHHRVQSRMLQGEVGLEDGGDHVSQRLGPFQGGQDVVVKVGVPAVQVSAVRGVVGM